MPGKKLSSGIKRVSKGPDFCEESHILKETAMKLQENAYI